MSFIAFLLSLSACSSSLTLSEQDGAMVGREELQALRECFFAGASVYQSPNEQQRKRARPVLSLLEGPGHQPYLRITMQEEASCPWLPTLLEALTDPFPLRIGTHRYLVQALDLSRSEWVGFATWADFLHPPVGQTITFHLGTPLVLPLEMYPPSCRKVYHFPAPFPLFSELARRWQELGGPPLPVGHDALLPLLEDGSVVLADYRLHAEAVRLDPSARPGFRGWLCYECRTSLAPVQTTLAALARFAFFAGIGAFTEQGMGTTRVMVREGKKAH
jgi:hypothetical protein